MSVALVLLCLTIGDLPGTLQWEDGQGTDAFLRLRAGAWGSKGFEFEATRVDSTFVRVNEQAMASFGLDAGFEFSNHYVVFATYEAGFTDDLFADLTGVCVGYRDRGRAGAPPAVPHEVTIYVGGFLSHFEVDEPGFGDFDDAFGFRAGIAFTWFAARRIAVSVIGEYRLVEYEYEEPVASGDKEAGGSTAWVGLGVEARF